MADQSKLDDFGNTSSMAGLSSILWEPSNIGSPAKGGSAKTLRGFSDASKGIADGGLGPVRDAGARLSQDDQASDIVRDGIEAAGGKGSPVIIDIHVDGAGQQQQDAGGPALGGLSGIQGMPEGPASQPSLRPSAPGSGSSHGQQASEPEIGSLIDRIRDAMGNADDKSGHVPEVSAARQLADAPEEPQSQDQSELGLG